MHIALNAQLLNTIATYRSAGVSNYSRHLIEALGSHVSRTPSTPQPSSPTRPELTAFVNVADFSTPGVRLICSSLPLQQPLLRIGWEQSILPWALQQHKADLIHGLVNVLPVTTKIPGVVTVHDLSFVRTPEKLPAAKRWYLTKLCRASVQKAQQVIAVSRQTADDLIQFFDIPATKISVIHNGVAERFQPQSATAVAAFRHNYRLPDRYLLYLGTLEPRKNLPRLIHAYHQWRTQASSSDHDIKLVLAGGKGWFYDQIFQLVQELDLTDAVLFPGFIPDTELPLWYSAAELFIYPSIFEGFGFPVLEAMACGTPVICSNISTLQEVAGESALFFPPDHTDQLTTLLHQLLTDTQLQNELQAQGYRRAARFSWQQTAAATLDVYENALSAK